MSSECQLKSDYFVWSSRYGPQNKDSGNTIAVVTRSAREVIQLLRFFALWRNVNRLPFPERWHYIIDSFWDLYFSTACTFAPGYLAVVLFGTQQRRFAARKHKQTLTITLLQWMISDQQRMACSRDILAHDKRFPWYCTWFTSTMFGLRQGNDRTRYKSIFLQFIISIQHRMVCSMEY